MICFIYRSGKLSCGHISGEGGGGGNKIIMVIILRYKHLSKCKSAEIGINNIITNRISGGVDQD